MPQGGVENNEDFLTAMKRELLEETNIKSIKIIKEIEKKYTHFKGLNKQILSSQATSTPYHDRFYYPPTTYNENLYWLI